MVGGERKKYTDQEKKDIFDFFLRCIDREDNLIHYRMSWGLQFNLALFAGLIGFLDLYKSDALILNRGIFAFGVVGILCSVATFIGVLAAHSQINYLINKIESKFDIHDSEWTGNNQKYIRPFGQKNTAHRIALWVARSFPLIFVIIWLILILFPIIV